jgi:hypothetical protein
VGVTAVKVQIDAMRRVFAAPLTRLPSTLAAHRREAQS